MKKLFLLFAFLGIILTSSQVKAQEQELVFEPTVDFMYTCQQFKVMLRNDINDQLQSVYFCSKTKWLEYEIIENEYLDPERGWKYTLQDGVGNKFTIYRPSAESDISIADSNGSRLDLRRTKY